MSTIIFLALFAALSRANGSGFWGHVNSDFLSRIIPATLMATLIMLSGGEVFGERLTSLMGAQILLTLEFFVYFAPAVNPHSSVAMNGDVSGGQLTQYNDAPLDWLLARLKLPTTTIMQRRVWGLAGCCIRQLMLVPVIILIALLTGRYALGIGCALLTPLVGTAYFLAGFTKASDPRAIAEALRGLFIGLIITLELGGLS